MSDDKVAEFVTVTGSDADTAKFYLESAGGDVSSAVESFFANTDAPPESTEATPSVPAVSTATSQPQQSPQPRGVTGLNDLDDDKSEEDGPEDNEYYAGGEKSGVAVRGGKNQDNVEDVFESARQHGAVQGTEADLTPQSGVRAFTGQARTLAGDVTSHPPANQQAPPVTIAFYTNGIFTVDDGEPRSMNDPQNAEFMRHIREGVCPPELVNREGGRPTNVNLVRKGTEYTPPARPKYKAFSGTGQTLSSGTPSSQQVNSEFAGDGEWKGADESLPTTSIQIRLSDGSRVVARFNYSHTVRDIRRFIAVSRPDLPAGGPMMTGFPSKTIEDDTQTVEQAGLVNAVVIQK